MLKKVICVCTLVLGVSAMDAMAVPTVRKVGVNNQGVTTTNTSGNKLGTKINTRTSRAPLSVNSVTNTRVPIVSKAVKNIKTSGGSTPATTPGSQQQQQPAPSGQTSDIVAISDKVAAIEAQTNQAVSEVAADVNVIADKVNTMEDNMITGVEVTSGEGSYVTSVAADGNTLMVNKTNMLYAPVHNGSSNTVDGTAEIWIVR